MKKSYHSRDVPTRLATITRRTEEGALATDNGGLAWDMRSAPFLERSDRA
jgi:hypothetical protein